MGLGTVVTGHREAIIGLINLSLSLVLAESTRIDTLIVPGSGETGGGGVLITGHEPSPSPCPGSSDTVTGD